jgi:xanthine dehydrogenase accessory factor
MRKDLLQLAADLAKQGQPFVLAMVVRREPYSSAQPGDMAVITSDGQYHGWLGGNCTQPTVKREAQAALADGKPRLVSLSPDPKSQERPGVMALPMTCHSGGSVDIYLEPMLPAPRLLLFGESPCARALAKLSEVMGYSVEHEPLEEPASPATGGARKRGALEPGHGGKLFAVIATMGENDEESLAAALAAKPAYVGVVASRKRFAELRESMLLRGIAASVLDEVHNPAGIDIGARLPEEVALSIFAEIVQLRQAEGAVSPEEPAAATSAIDPVCGMTVTMATAKHRGQHQGRDYYFCNGRCKEKFLAFPDHFLAA